MNKFTGTLLILLLSTIIFFGCVSFNPSLGIMSFGQTAVEEYQTLEGIETTESLVIVPIGSSFKNDDDMGLKIVKIALNGDIQKFMFQTEVHTGGSFTFWDSISVKLDSNIYTLQDNNPKRHVRPGDYFFEIFTFEISPEMFEELRTSKTFSVQLFKRVVTLNEKKLQILKGFCNNE